jgi:hypothetical protein
MNRIHVLSTASKLTRVNGRFLILAAGGLVIAWLLLLQGASRAGAATANSVLTEVKGDVQVRVNDAFDFQPATAGQALIEGERVHTGAGASARITFFDGSSLLLAANSEVILTRIDDGALSGAMSIVVTQEAGTSTSDASPAAGGASFYVISTPLGNVTGNGAQFAVSLSRGGLDVRGAAGVTQVKSGSLDFLVGAGDEAFFAFLGGNTLDVDVRTGVVEAILGVDSQEITPTMGFGAAVTSSASEEPPAPPEAPVLPEDAGAE